MLFIEIRSIQNSGRGERKEGREGERERGSEGGREGRKEGERK